MTCASVGHRTDTVRGEAQCECPTKTRKLTMKTDSQLKRDVNEELNWEPQVSATQIGVEVNDGIATLSGEVGSYAEKWNAERAAQRVSGVHALTVDLLVKLSGTGQRTDVDIAKSVEHALTWSTSVPDSIKVMVEKGFVTLKGEVNWQYQRLAATDSVRPLLGVKGISNQIAIKPLVKASAVQSEIETALKRTAVMDAKKIHVSVTGSDVTLTGKIHNWAERESATMAAWGAPGVMNVHDKMLLDY